MYLCSVIKKQLTLKSKQMDKEEIEQLIARKEKEIKQLLELKDLLKSEHIEIQIDMRLDDLSKLYKEVREHK